MIEKNYEQIAQDIKNTVIDNLPLTQLTDDELYEKIEASVVEKTRELYLPINDKVDIIENIYSSIRGLGILDTIMKDNSANGSYDKRA